MPAPATSWGCWLRAFPPPAGAVLPLVPQTSFQFVQPSVALTVKTACSSQREMPSEAGREDLWDGGGQHTGRTSLFRNTQLLPAPGAHLLPFQSKGGTGSLPSSDTNPSHRRHQRNPVGKDRVTPPSRSADCPPVPCTVEILLFLYLFRGLYLPYIVVCSSSPNMVK